MPCTIFPIPQSLALLRYQRCLSVIEPGNERSITVSEISNLLSLNYDGLYDVEDIFDAECFVSHFNAEEPSLKIPEDIGIKPFEIIQRLKILSRRKEFKGTCPVCESWHKSTM